MFQDEEFEPFMTLRGEKEGRKRGEPGRVVDFGEKEGVVAPGVVQEQGPGPRDQGPGLLR